jgi:hypothetical protein
MRKARAVPAIVLSVLLVGGILVVSVLAKPPSSPPGQREPAIVSLTGPVTGIGAFANIELELWDGEFQGEGMGSLIGSYLHEGGSFIANPDYPPALTVPGSRTSKELSYYYCAYPFGHTPEQTTDGICNAEDHTDYYKRLRILGGYVDKNTGYIIWPQGSEWRISYRKYSDDDNRGRVLTGYLKARVTYTVVEWTQ